MTKASNQNDFINFGTLIYKIKNLKPNMKYGENSMNFSIISPINYYHYYFFLFYSKFITYIMILVIIFFKLPILIPMVYLPIAFN